MKDGFLKAAALSPALRVADCAYNVRQITDALHKAAARGVKLAVFPEFCLTGYTCGDLFLQRTLQQGALTGLQELLDASRELDTVALVGLPLMVRGKLYNCAAVLCRGQLLGLVPKTYLPNYGEFYEKRQFTPGSTEVENVTVCGQEVPFGTSLLFRCRQMPSFVLGVELCEDLWSALPPSTFHALAGATVIANISGSPITVAKSVDRHLLCASGSARYLAAYLYAAGGEGESSTDLAWDGQTMIYESGTLLAESERFPRGPRASVADVDLGTLGQERLRQGTFDDNRRVHGERTGSYRTVEFALQPPSGDLGLRRPVARFPFVPADPQRLAQDCYEAYSIQVAGLEQRLRAALAQGVPPADYPTLAAMLDACQAAREVLTMALCTPK